MKTNTLFDQPNTEGKLPTDIGPMLQPLFTWRGMNVYPVFGAEGDGDDDGEPDSGSDGGEGGTGGEGTEDEGSGTVSRSDFEKLQAQLRAADKNRSAAEKRAKELEDAKKDEFTKATERVEELEKVTASQAKEIADMRLHNAFLTANTGITWHDPADALALAERQGYLAEVVNDEGKVDAGKLTAKLKELAKAKPHLVKDGNSKDEDKGGSNTPPARTGSNVGGKGKSGKEEPNLSRYDRHFNR